MPTATSATAMPFQTGYGPTSFASRTGEIIKTFDQKPGSANDCPDATKMSRHNRPWHPATISHSRMASSGGPTEG
jgi:hypothetical protein